MAQSITIQGATYNDVPAITLPKSGGGTAQFDDTTDADATASDISAGKTAYVNNVKIIGTGSGGGGGGTITQDASGYLHLSKDGGGGGGGTTPECPVTIRANMTQANANYFRVVAQMSSGQDYVSSTTSLYDYTSNPLSCYAVPRLDTSAEYAYQVTFVSTYMWAQPSLNISQSSDCTQLAISASGSGNHFCTIGCKPNAVIVINYTNYN